MTQKQDAKRPPKPYPSFPLSAHPNGQWVKKIRGRLQYFGSWDNPQAALDQYLASAADLHAGRTPTVSNDGLTVKQVVNAYLQHQEERVGLGEIGTRHFQDCLTILTDFGRLMGTSHPVADIGPNDLRTCRTQLAKRLGPRGLAKAISTVRTMFRYAVDVGLMDRPPRFAKVFERPPARVIRQSRQQPRNLFKVEEVNTILGAIGRSDVPTPSLLGPCTLLGLNGGMGNTDMATLPKSAVDLDNAVIDYPRPKTGEARIVPLWPETVAALHTWLEERPCPRDPEHEGLVFLTPRGFPLIRQNVRRKDDGSIDRVTNLDRLSHVFIDLLELLGLKRKRIGFYTLRHTFRTWADETKDHHAIYRLMGHTLPGMSSVYVEEIGMDRLRAVVDHVRTKVFGDAN